jgi:Nitroreductase family
MTRGPAETVAPTAFGLPPEQFAILLATTDRAPSLHHSRPWRLHPTPRTIELHADPTQSQVVADPDGRELRIACGAALFNLELAVHGHGIRPTVTILPDPARPGLLAVVRHGGTKDPTPERRDLLRAVAVRRTDRRPFTDTPVDTPSLHALRRAALDEAAWLHVVTDPTQLGAVRAIADRARREQDVDPAFRAELAACPDRSTGVPAGTNGMPGGDAGTEPVIAVLSSHQSGPAAEIGVGRALERVLLTATTAGLAASFLSPVTEVPDAREELRRLIGGTRPPQVVLRIGHGRPAPALPRHSNLLPDPLARSPWASSSC